MAGAAVSQASIRIPSSAILPFQIVAFGIAWYAFLSFGIPTIYAAGSLVKGNLFSQPWPYDTILFVLVALLVVWVNRDAMFGRENAVIEVVPA